MYFNEHRTLAITQDFEKMNPVTQPKEKKKRKGTKKERKIGIITQVLSEQESLLAKTSWKIFKDVMHLLIRKMSHDPHIRRIQQAIPALIHKLYYSITSSRLDTLSSLFY